MSKNILIVGDNHISSNNRSNHTDYANESLDCLKFIEGLVRERGIEYYIDLGDISYGKFDLAYRAKVEDVFTERFNLLDGRCFSVRGNHDISNKGISEWEFYTKYRKCINNSRELVKVIDGYNYFDTDGIRWHLIDFGKESTELELNNDGMNFICAHNFIKFESSNVPNFGTGIDLDKFENWFGIDGVFCGHVHHNLTLEGTMTKDGHSKNVFVYYPGSIVRTDFVKDLPEHGEVCIVHIENGKLSLERVAIPWIPEEEAFQVADIIKEKKKVDISDIVKTLNDRERNIGDPEVVIHNMTGFEQKYKDKAIELLREV